MKATLLLIVFATACASSSAPAAPPGTASSAVQHETPSADRSRVNVTLSGSRPMPEVVRDLEQRGLVVEQRLEQIGVVSGRVPPDGVAALRGVSGVKAVELDQPVQLPPAGKPQ